MDSFCCCAFKFTTLSFWSVQSNLLITLFSVLFISHTIFFIPKNLMSLYFLYNLLTCFYFIFLNICNREFLLWCLFLFYNLCHFWVHFYWLIFLLIMDCMYLLLCMPRKFLLDARHFKFCILTCWLFCIFLNNSDLCLRFS